MADDPANTEETPKEETTVEQPTNEEVQETSPDESTTEPSQTEEEATEQSEETEEETQAPAQEDGADEAPEQMSRRKAKRLEKLEGLVERLKGPQPSQQKAKSDGIDYRQLLEADEEVYTQLETKSQEYGQAQYNAGLEQAKAIQFHTRLEIDAPRVESKYPQFDKDSPEFNPALANSINEWYLATAGYNPQTDTVQNANVRYAEFVEGIMEVADAMASSKNTKSAQNIAKQAASTALRPDGSRNKSFDLSKDPGEMDKDELEAAIARTLPRDNRGRFTSQK